MFLQFHIRTTCADGMVCSACMGAFHSAVRQQELGQHLIIVHGYAWLARYVACTLLQCHQCEPVGACLRGICALFGIEFGTYTCVFVRSQSCAYVDHKQMCTASDLLSGCAAGTA